MGNIDAATLETKITQLGTDADLMHEYVHGDENTVVTLGGVPTPSLRRFMKTIDQRESQAAARAINQAMDEARTEANREISEMQGAAAEERAGLAADAAVEKQGVATEGASQRAKVVNEGAEQFARVEEEGNTQVQRIVDEGNAQTMMLNTQGDAVASRLNQLKAASDRTYDSLLDARRDANTAYDNLQDAMGKARVAEINMVEATGHAQEVSARMNVEAAANLEQIETARAAALHDVQAKENSAVQHIETLESDAVQHIAQRGDQYTAQVRNSGDQYLSRLNAVGNDRLQEIQETINTAGNTQVARVENEGDAQVERLNRQAGEHSDALALEVQRAETAADRTENVLSYTHGAAQAATWELSQSMNAGDTLSLPVAYVVGRNGLVLEWGGMTLYQGHAYREKGEEGASSHEVALLIPLPEGAQLHAWVSPATATGDIDATEQRISAAMGHMEALQARSEEITAEADAHIAAINTAGEENAQRIADAAQEAQTGIADSKDAALQAVSAAGAEQTASVNEAGARQTHEVTDAGEAALNAIGAERVSTLAAITEEGAAQVRKVTDRANTAYRGIASRLETAENDIESLATQHKTDMAEQAERATSEADRAEAAANLATDKASVFQGQNLQAFWYTEKNYAAGEELVLPITYVVGWNNLQLSYGGMQLYQGSAYAEVGETNEVSRTVLLLMPLPEGAQLNAWSVYSNLSSGVQETMQALAEALSRANAAATEAEAELARVKDAAQQIATGTISTVTSADALDAAGDGFFVVDPGEDAEQAGAGDGSSSGDGADLDDDF